MEEQGLAQQAAAQGAGGMGQQMPTVEEIAALLAQGITPEELMAAGVPQQLIEQAMGMLQQMSQQGPTQQAGMEQGLAQAGMM
jgi:hypothetical protein